MEASEADSFCCNRFFPILGRCIMNPKGGWFKPRHSERVGNWNILFCSDVGYVPEQKKPVSLPYAPSKSISNQYN